MDNALYCPICNRSYNAINDQTLCEIRCLLRLFIGGDPETKAGFHFDENGHLWVREASK